jgi:dTMP kinase
MPSAVRGKFITFEGGEGAGKSSQVRRLAMRLVADGHEVIATREPGGTPAAEAIRHFVLSGKALDLGPKGEAALMAAARADHVKCVILPALAAGKWVLCDRFMDSTRVYQGGPDGAPADYIAALERVAIGKTWPDLTFILDVPAEAGLARLRSRQSKVGSEADRFERDDLARHEQRRQAFLEIASREPQRCVVIDASDEEEAVAAAINEAVKTRLPATVS